MHKEKSIEKKKKHIKNISYTQNYPHLVYKSE